MSFPLAFKSGNGSYYIRFPSTNTGGVSTDTVTQWCAKITALYGTDLPNGCTMWETSNPMAPTQVAGSTLLSALCVDQQFQVRANVPLDP